MSTDLAPASPQLATLLPLAHQPLVWINGGVTRIQRPVCLILLLSRNDKHLLTPRCEGFFGFSYG